jgi:hypothetical protein
VIGGEIMEEKYEGISISIDDLEISSQPGNIVEPKCSIGLAVMLAYAAIMIDAAAVVNYAAALNGAVGATALAVTYAWVKDVSK